jgi:hypothetical protein
VTLAKYNEKKIKQKNEINLGRIKERKQVSICCITHFELVHTERKRERDES